MSARIRRTVRRGRLAGLALSLGLALMLTGCSLGKDLYNTPLPGGADVGDHPLEITADFDDVVDLVPQSSVKVENIAVGRVATIELNPDGRSARATLLVRNDVDLPKGTTARIQQTSLLGEKYVALIRPTSSTSTAGSLQSGANISISDTSQVAEVEQVLGALSLVVNGGGLAKFQDISRELQQVSGGRPEEIRGFLDNMETFMTSLNARKGAITTALDSLATLSTTLDNDKDKIAEALEGLSPGLKVLAEQRGQLVDMLEALHKLSDVSVRTLNASQKDMVKDMELLEPILRELAESGDALPNSLELLLTYPFPDSVLDAIKGDYLNVFATANYSSLPDTCTGIGCPWPQPVDEGTLPPFDTGARTSGQRAPLSGVEKSTDKSAKKPAKSPSAGKSPSGSASPSPSGSASPNGDPSPSADSSKSGSPSPSLLPPTDSALPGLPEQSVQVPSPSTSPSATAEASSTSSPKDD
jgi:phospholipid/cholesterol/gamma-HCH transport system substrate-binding protein